jgi:hypothetical protein
MKALSATVRLIRSPLNGVVNQAAIPCKPYDLCGAVSGENATAWGKFPGGVRYRFRLGSASARQHRLVAIALRRGGSSDTLNRSSAFLKWNISDLADADRPGGIFLRTDSAGMEAGWLFRTGRRPQSLRRRRYKLTLFISPLRSSVLSAGRAGAFAEDTALTQEGW